MTKLLSLAIVGCLGCATGLTAADDTDLADAAGAGDSSLRPADAAPDARARADASPEAPTEAPDAAPAADARSADVDAGRPDAAPAAPYRHTIAIDGDNDFAAADRFDTTSPGYTAYLSWDDELVYVGYEGADIASDDPHKWVLVYLDVDPGAGTGALRGELYNTERPAFPAGFGAEYYLRWKADGAFENVAAFTGATWTDAGIAPISRRAGAYLEVAIPRAPLGAPLRLGVVAFMLNETPSLEAAYAGLYADSFADGYHALIPIARYLEADFTSPRAPNAPANRRPADPAP